MNRIEKESSENAKHIAILNAEMGETRDHVKSIANEVTAIRTEVATIKADVDWMKRFFWIVASSSVGGLGVGMLNLINR